MANESARVHLAGPNERRPQTQRQTKTSTTTTITTTATTTTSQLASDSVDLRTRERPQESVAVVEELGKQAAQLSATQHFKPSPNSNSNSNSNYNHKRQATSQTQAEQQVADNAQLIDAQPKERYQFQFESSLAEAELLGARLDGSRLATTIGCIVAQRNDNPNNRIVVVLLKDGDALQLKIQEMRPSMFEVGLNGAESSGQLDEHRRTVDSLRRQQRAPIEAWLRRYERIADERPNMSKEMKLVYMCMAENLQGCWRALLGQLELRARLLDDTCKFYDATERLAGSIERAEGHVQTFRQHFLDGPTAGLKFSQAANELARLNASVLADYKRARQLERQVVQLVGQIGASNLCDSRANYLIADAQSLINYITNYIQPLERRKLQLESVITTTSTASATTGHNTDWRSAADARLNQRPGPGGSLAAPSNHNGHTAKTSATLASAANTSATGTGFIREISNFHDLNLVESWLKTKVDQLNSSLLSSLGVNVQDSRSILAKHEQIALECSAIEEATLMFNGRNIHAIKSTEAPTDNDSANGKSKSQINTTTTTTNNNNNLQNGDRRKRSLFEVQKSLAERARDVITILDARIVLLRRSIDFYLRAKDASLDIGKMMRRLQVDNSLQSVQFVANELELKDVSSVIASGATIISELQQLQLAQKHGQRSDVVNLNLLTNGIRLIIDQLSQELASLKTCLNQRKLVLLNEDAAKMAHNYSTKCRQLHHWLDNNAKSFLLANSRLGPNADEARAFCDGHDQLRAALQNKTLEVEALLRLLSTLSKSLEVKSDTANEIQRDTDELRQDWINVTNCLEARLELARKYLAILGTASMLDKELDSLEPAGELERPKTPQERTDDEIRSNVDQQLAQMGNQVKNFELDARKSTTSLVYRPGMDAKAATASDINKQQLVEHAAALVAALGARRQAANGAPARQRTGEASRTSSSGSSTTKTKVSTTRGSRMVSGELGPSELEARVPGELAAHFVRPLEDKHVEPFSSVELECETAPGSSWRLDWQLNHKKIPSNVKHSIVSDGHKHKLIISHFSPMCCGLYSARATNQAGQSVESQCRLRLSGIEEQEDVGTAGAELPRPVAASAGPSASPGAASSTSSFSQWRPNKSAGQHQTSSERALERLIRPVEGADGEVANSKQQATTTTTTASTTTTTGASVVHTSELAPDGQAAGAGRVRRLPVTQSSYNGEPRQANYLIESPISSASLQSRSISRSPFEGTPQPPVFMEPLADSNPRSCSRAGLVCVVVGNPPPTIEWLHNNTPIATARCPRPPSGGRASICKLTIETINDKTKGQYVCRASNRAGQTSTALTLNK